MKKMTNPDRVIALNSLMHKFSLAAAEAVARSESALDDLPFKGDSRMLDALIREYERAIAAAEKIAK